MSDAPSTRQLRSYEPVPSMPEGVIDTPGATTRREFLKLLSASLALGTAACSGPPVEKILPYVDAPEALTPGVPLYYASAYVKHGYAHGVLIESNMGRPTKVEGNPLHPASLGATDAQTQGAVLEFWDPDRAQTVYQGGVTSSWAALRAALDAAMVQAGKQHGAGLRILSGSVTSPTLIAQMRALLQRYPEARWHTYQPLHDDAAARGAALAFGRPLDCRYRLDRVRTLVTLDARLFSRLPGSVRYARDYVSARRTGLEGTPVRLYAAEAGPSLDGAIADDRFSLTPPEIEQLIWGVAAALELAPGVRAEGGSIMGRRQQAIAAALQRSRGASLIVGGPTLTPATHVLIHALNAQLGNVGRTVDYIEPIEAHPEDHVDSLRALVDDMRAGRVRLLVMLGGNPVYDAPADVGYADALGRVPFSLHHALYRNETSLRCTWHAPLAHVFESWSDARAHDGTATIVQPVARPLYTGRSWHELLAWLAGEGERSAHDVVQSHWRAAGGRGDFADRWHATLRNGIVADSASRPVSVRVTRTPPPPRIDAAPLQVVLMEDDSVGDGEYSNNAWLQELPRPLTKLTWDNALIVGAATAHRMNAGTGDVVRLAKGAQSIEAPVWVLPGLAENLLVLPAGYGRWAAGRVGNGVGYNAYALLGPDHAPLQITPTGRRHRFATTQNHSEMEGRDIVRHARWDEYRHNPRFANDEKREQVPRETLYPAYPYEGYKWGMAVDLNACIGCNACTMACQAENNIPVVGKEEVIRGREMHWIRVDRYYEGPLTAPRIHFQPVPCMHCETAPCEEVCPVGATVHDSEGLNVQVYNRCIGTRFCSNNCPYKVRRFNFLQYSNTTVESLKAMQNPEVTVRRRGVMEKCNYCLQRITRGRIEAEKEGRRLRDGEVVTACQAVCPTQAITFGDLNDPDSAVTRVKASPLNYALLAELNTRPRTTYLARVLNPDLEL
jgi:molybdopterin-containing oxidoreductase family iron-sulfur binding subunit